LKNEIILYQADETAKHIEVRLSADTVWLNRNQLAALLGRDVKTIGKHISNVFTEGELSKSATVANFATVQLEGGRLIERLIEYYNLDVVISVGYRVKSKQGTQFRIWATNILRDYLLKGYAINQRIERIENNYENLNNEIKRISLQLKTQELPTQGIFFDGQVFDAYAFASELIKKAKKEIILIDNYINEITLTHLAKKAKNVKAQIFTRKISKPLVLDVQKANEQYGNFEVHELTNSHDRFLIIDRNELYHLGASLKDLGKKWFAFSKLDGITETILGKLNVE
jgi:hypothetical protein